MTREIKFRAWDPSLREMHAVSAIYFQANSSLMGTSPYVIDEHNDLHDLASIVLMQYTGLKDKFGREIYEGDVLSEGGIVGWCDACLGLQTFWIDEIGVEICHHCEGDYALADIVFTVDDAPIQVIGNIYEHGALLNG